VNAGDDQTICIGEITTLQGIGSPTFTYLWTSIPEDLTISDPTILTPTIQPFELTEYTLEGRSVSFTNLVVSIVTLTIFYYHYYKFIVNDGIKLVKTIGIIAPMHIQ